MTTLLAVAGCGVTPSRPVTPASEIPVPVPTPAPIPAPALPPGAVPDAVPRFEARSRAGNPTFYNVAGKRYFVLATSEGYSERGVASWYGKDFHAKSTSNGESYDMYAMTAAHKTLPLPCYAKVTNLSNGRSVIVRINDRGPFVANRIIDLSYSAASRLDMTRAGTAFVEVTVLQPEATTPGTVQAAAEPTIAAAGALYVQAGAFAQRDNAARLQQQLATSGVKDAQVREERAGEQLLYKLHIGPLANVAEFDALVKKLGTLGVAGRLATN
ncbi:MAG: septal ring lytic transglycosylase RlpA family protein [Steroidobacteraceae bacterium]